MFKNYLKTTFRNLWKNKTYSFINIIGLAFGTLCCLYILLFVEAQYSFDKHHTSAEDIYRIDTWLTINGDKHNNATSSPPIAPAMKSDFAEVAQFTRLTSALGIKQSLLKYNEKLIYEKDLAFVDSTFFDVFTYHFVAGSPAKALAAPYSIVLKKQVAEKLFGADNPLGKMIEMENAYGKHKFKVTAVIDESLGSTHIKGNMFVPMNSGGIGQYVMTSDMWSGNNFVNAYVKLNSKADVALLEKKLPAFLENHGAQQLKDIGMVKKLHLQPVSSIHTNTNYENEMDKTVSPAFLYILLLIAAMIQIIACINFMNLSTARASKRAKEVGVRKVIGAGRNDLLRQFLGESFLLSLIGVLIALPLLLVALPYLNQLTNASISLSFFSDYRLWIMLGGLVVVTGLIAGSYPAFYLSAFKAIKVIKGNFTNNTSAAGIRRSLVVFQFVLSIVLISGIIIIYSQLNYINKKDLGFEKEQKLIFTFYTEETKGKIPVLANDLLQIAEIKDVASSNNYLGNFVLSDMAYYLAGGNMAGGVDAKNMLSDEHFVKANGIALLAGRDLRQHDSGKVLVNETFVKRIGLSVQTAPGTKLFSKFGDNPEVSVEIAGVMKDFNYNSLHKAVDPFMLFYTDDRREFGNMIVSTNSKNYTALLSKIEKVWQKDFAATPFEYAFLDDEIQKLYETEITMGRIINSFTLMAIFISCLGLFGLATFSAEQRSKEIGIRKVLGASVTGIVQLLSKDFLKLIAIAIVIATPIAWWAMNTWLQNFEYKVTISWWMFALAGLFAIIIAVFTISFKSIKAAVANPVESLRTE